MPHPHPTEQYFQRVHKNGYVADASGVLGSTPYRVTRIGFGGYRITDASHEHAMALQKALLYGCNVIDTSSNYTDGGSERLIGRVLGEMQELELLNRDEIMIISKAGYIQGENMRIAKDQRNSGRGFPELVEYSETCWHCIHPEFLDDQLERSRERLAVEHIDLYLLHNPEYFLLDCKRKGERDLAAIRRIFYQRIRQAFVWMEEQVARGLIRYYGVSSNTMPAASQDTSFVSLEQLLSIAESIAVDHHFRAIQFPLNLYEQGAASCRNQEDDACTLLEFAQQHRIGTFVNRPLNAMTDEGLMRLASFRFCDPHQITRDFKTQLAAAGKFEKTFHTEMLPLFPAESSAHTAAEFLHLSQLLKSSLHDYKNWLQWDQFRQQYLLTGLSAAFQELNNDLLRDKQWKQWSIDYISAIARLLDTIGLLYESRQQLYSQSLMNSMEELSASMEAFPTLSQQSLSLTRSIPGVDCVLVGMRQDRYVDDALAVLHRSAVPDALRILSEFDTTM